MDTRHEAPKIRTGRAGSAREVFTAFFKLGLTSFGGPIAHFGYFRHELVERRNWIGESHYAQLLTLCQFLPGPASSQLGFSLGLLRAGWPGALAAFAAFTLPSAVLLLAFAAVLPKISGIVGDAAIHGLKLVALAVVAQGVVGMARQLCPDAPRLTIAILAAAAVLVAGQAWTQLLVAAFGAVAGLIICRKVLPVQGGGIELRYGRRLGAALSVLYVILLVGLPLAAYAQNGLIAVAAAFYRSGALVFGGGHVVLPLLQDAVVRPGWISQSDFLAGYGAAQAVPGPMFTLAAYLGARLPDGEGGVIGACVAFAAIFLPGLLLVSGALPFWHAIANRPAAARAVAGVNASVVGVLAAALYNPVWTSAVRGPIDVVIALVGFALLAARKVSAIFVVIWCIAASVASAIW